MPEDSFKIKWTDGSEKTITYKTDLSIGELEDILESCFDPTSRSKINMKKFANNLVNRVVKNPPWQSINEFRTLHWSIAPQVYGGLAKEYPLTSLLATWISLVSGPMNTNDTSSMPSVPTSLAGTTGQSEDSQQNT